MDRRIFLKKNLAGLFTAGFIANWGTMEQIRTYIQQDKPLLTQNNLNRFFANSRRNSKLLGDLAALKEDIAGFLREHFSLSPAQDKIVDSFNPEDLKQMGELAIAAIQENLAPVVKFGEQRAGKCAKTQISLNLPNKQLKVML